jgi:hypothetical protein
LAQEEQVRLQAAAQAVHDERARALQAELTRLANEHHATSQAAAAQRLNLEESVHAQQTELAQLHASLANAGEAATRAQSEMARLAAIAESGMCVICLGNKANMLVLDCKHLCLCQECHATVGETLTKCPLCQDPIQRLLLVYLP